ncbi:MAG: hypothetical protein A2275_12545 [Bacteroidetes bacterium RIFOXYA12_FULL_35_11]|nr:MAG: hypothetical protein A2X01_16885 [Bacteroidetes bacterium GWF2_35_48]OFY74927.1 MAG: hypothetical protein A2275_12545 [Bacteroidetes bacterium RIFOXYA12_FULL_35_11]OFZ02150.1 MAG: hypothetical protein A2491_11305 [Bacteroidetes bacterium RIFOXYC12_FULL_35_7]HBX53385.1 phosphate ABC transporter substrate-binding protein, PhoT family [Bacteroidales bacterium]
MRNKVVVIFFVLISIFIISCSQGDVKKIDETPTRGNIKIGVDESFQLLVMAEIDAFQSMYKYATINPSYRPENDLFSDFFKDSIRLMITTRKLTPQEEEGLKSNNIIARTTKIAYDALAFIIHKENPDSLIKFETIREIFSGNVSQWNQINSKSKLKEIRLVFDNPKSANVRFIMERFSLPVQFPDYCAAVNSNDEVINYVEKNKNAIGVISVNWISDKADTVSNKFLSKVKVVAVGSALGNNEYMLPYQAYIAEKSYPFIREVFMINRESFSGLGSGFTAYVAGEIGQRVVLRSGLVPATMPIRLVQFKKE